MSYLTSPSFSVLIPKDLVFNNSHSWQEIWIREYKESTQASHHPGSLCLDLAHHLSLDSTVLRSAPNDRVISAPNLRDNCSLAVQSTCPHRTTLSTGSYSLWSSLQPCPRQYKSAPVFSAFSFSTRMRCKTRNKSISSSCQDSCKPGKLWDKTKVNTSIQLHAIQKLY